MRHVDPISLIYDAALGECSWDDMLDAISAEADDAMMCLGIGDPRNPETLEIWARGFDPWGMIPDGFAFHDIWDPAHNPGIKAGLMMPVGQSFDRRYFVSEEEYFAAPFMRHFHENVRLKAERLYVPLREDDLLAGGFIAKPGAAEIEEDAARRFDHLLPHLGRGLRLRDEVGRYRGVAESLKSVLDRLPVAVLLVDTDLHILVANVSADAILAASDGLTSAGSALRATPPARERDLRRRVAAVARFDGEADGATLRLQRTSALPAYLLRIFPAIGACNLPKAQRAAATLVIHDPASPAILPDASYLRAALGLTHAEAEVARLVPLALSKRQMGERLGLTENTIRFHLAAMRAKLGARNVTDLARTIDRVCLTRGAR